MTKPMVKGNFQIQKMTGKGAWSYVLLPIHVPKTGLPFGWCIVKGLIDDYEIEQFKLWPTKDKQLFLPIKAAIRKRIKKEAGDFVFIELYYDNSSVAVPDEFQLVLEEFPSAAKYFYGLSETSKKQYIDYIYSVKSKEAKDRRLEKTIEKLEQGLKFHMK
jgi:hypothetical protein